MKVAALAFLVSCAGSWAARWMPLPPQLSRPPGVAGPGAVRWLAALSPPPGRTGGLLARLDRLASLVTRHRREKALAAALPDLLDRLAGDLRSGGSLLAAVQGAASGSGPLAPDLRRISDRVAAGTALADALAAWPGERPGPAVAAMAAALEVAATVGGRAAPALEALAGGLRDQRDTRLEAAALSAQARVSALVVGLAPVGSLALAALADRRVPTALLESAPGRVCLAVGVGLDGLAFLWMRRLIRGRR